LLNCPALVAEFHVSKGKRDRRQVQLIVARNNPASPLAGEGEEAAPSKAVTIQADLLEFSAAGLLQKICDDASIDPKDLLIVWASPPCRTFSPADYSNISRNNNFRDHTDPTRPPTRSNPAKAAIARDHDLLVQRIWEFIDHCRTVGADARCCMENPRGSLACREYMQVGQLPQRIRQVTVDQCAFGRDYRKATDLWHDVPSWRPSGRTGDGRCHGRCGKGYVKNGFFRHHKALAMEPIRGPRGRGHTKEKNALPAELLEEFALEVMRTTSNLEGRVVLDLCAGFQSWAPVAAKLGCKYVAVDVLGARR